MSRERMRQELRRFTDRETTSPAECAVLAIALGGQDDSYHSHDPHAVIAAGVRAIIQGMNITDAECNAVHEAVDEFMP